MKTLPHKMANPPDGFDVYELLASKAEDVENELRRLNRWQDLPLSPDKFEDMGAFGSNTMNFEQWIQFVLVPRIGHIVLNKGELPMDSMLATYAIRVFDGDPDASNLIALLGEIDELVNLPPQEIGYQSYSEIQPREALPPENDTVSLGDETIPQVVYSLAEVLNQFEGDDLESQLQTFDTFIDILSPAARNVISDLLRKAGEQAANIVTKERIERAASAVAIGGRAAECYDHDEAMRRYRDKREDNFR
jgi:uncharacterized protein YqcC (DUF446 family)